MIGSLTIHNDSHDGSINDKSWCDGESEIESNGSDKKWGIL